MIVSVADDPRVVRNSTDDIRILVNWLKHAVNFFQIDLSAEFDVNGLAFARNFPDVALIEPFVWKLDLIAINELLLEQAVLVANPVAVDRKSVGCARIHEGARQTTEATVSQSHVAFCFGNLIQTESHLFKGRINQFVPAHVQKVALEQPPWQKLD